VGEIKHIGMFSSLQNPKKKMVTGLHDQRKIRGSQEDWKAAPE
jgi:hypothetical protein